MKRLIFTFLLAGSSILMAQTPISNIQTPVSASNDTSVMKGQTVTVEGIVVTDPTKWYQATNNYSFWIQTKGQSGPKTGIQIRLQQGNSQGANTGVTGLTPGTEISLSGKVDYFQGETQIALDTTQAISILNLGQTISGPSVITVGTLNNASNVAQATGEQYQGSWVEIQNVTVVSVTGTAGRGNFTVQDAGGNRVDIWDANIDMRNSVNGFSKPSVGSVFTSIKGIVYHRGINNKYELHPWNAADLVVGAAPPTVSSVSRIPACPTPAGNVTVNSVVTAPNGETITGVVLYYAVGASTTTYTQVPMTETTPGNWSASIPMQADGSIVHYYVIATDNTGDTKKYPSFTPLFYRVNTNGCTIYDIQYVPQAIIQGTSTWNESGYNNLAVTGVKGVVTSSVGDLGYIFIQESGKTAWAGIQVIGDATVNTLNVGDSVTISGDVTEYFGHTQIKNATAVKHTSGNPVIPVMLPVATMTDTMSLNLEAYESMFLRYEETGGLYVVNALVDGVNANHKGDWRVGADQFDPNRGVRILTGRATNNIFSSLNCAYVNDITWQVTDGAMNVTPIVVTSGMQVNSIQGIMMYQWSTVKVLPRNTADVDIITSKEKFATKNISFYPNPVQNQLFVNVEGKGTIVIFDINGKEVMKTSVENGTNNISTSNLNNGTYMLQLIQNDTVVSHGKVVVMK